MTRRPDRRLNRPQHSDPLRDPSHTHHDTPCGDPVTPIAVWQLDSHTADQLDADPGPDTVFASRLANHLVRIYTNRGDTVLDLDLDPHLHAAAETTNRTYLAITDAADIATLDELHVTNQAVGLITARWATTSPPDTTPPATTAAITDLFIACHLIGAGRATVIVAVPSTTATDITAAHGQPLITAAEEAGFVHTLQIIAVSSPRYGDAFTYYATPAEAARVAAEASPSVELLVFTPTPTPKTANPQRVTPTIGSHAQQPAAPRTTR